MEDVCGETTHTLLKYITQFYIFTIGVKQDSKPNSRIWKKLCVNFISMANVNVRSKPSRQQGDEEDAMDLKGDVADNLPGKEDCSILQPGQSPM